MTEIPPQRVTSAAGVTTVGSAQRTSEAAAECERAIAAAERDGPATGVHPRVHQEMIEATWSELAVLGEHIDAK